MPPLTRLDAAGSYGFHWFPDDQHFGLELVERFVPHLNRLGARWLVLRASLEPVEGATAFAARLREAGVEPLLHLVPKAGATPDALRRAAEGWMEGGVRVIAFDDQPNRAARWPQWEPRGLPQRYAHWLAPFLGTLAEFEGVTPLFPPLAPGGDFWDTTFLDEALAELRAINPAWLHRLGVAYMNNLAGRPVTWGKGGPAQWGPSLRARRDGREDHVGFRAWEWAAHIAQQRLGRSVPLYTLSTRLSPTALTDADAHHAEARAVRHALETEAAPPVLGATFWLLADEPHSPTLADAWFGTDGTPLHLGSIAALEAAVQPKLRRASQATLPTTVRVRMASGKVQRLPIEEYLRGLLPNEMSPIAPPEALRAQAVALRCYVARAARAPRHDAEGADLCATDHCKLWHPNHYERTDEAVRHTAGVVATYEGHIIAATTFQRCAGRTRSSAEVWKTSLAYSRAVACVASGGTQQGHGVGMCRQGAIRMAQQGASFEDVLRHYFVGITVATLETMLAPTVKAVAANSAPPEEDWWNRPFAHVDVATPPHTLDEPLAIPFWERLPLLTAI